MAQTGILESIRYREYGGGKMMAVLGFEGGTSAVAFGKTVDAVKCLTTGSRVEYSSKPAEQEGRDPMITFIKVCGTNATSRGPQAPTIQKQTGYKAADNRSEDAKQLSIFFSYAKDLVAGGVVKTPAATPTAVADLVGTLATELRRKYDGLLVGAEATPEAVGAMTEPLSEPDSFR